MIRPLIVLAWVDHTCAHHHEVTIPAHGHIPAKKNSVTHLNGPFKRCTIHIFGRKHYFFVRDKRTFLLHKFLQVTKIDFPAN